jgi:hypothetical protein
MAQEAPGTLTRASMPPEARNGMAVRTGFARVIPQKRLNAVGEVFRAWFECSDCQAVVHLGDRFCRWCGVQFWTPRKRD